MIGNMNFFDYAAFDEKGNLTGLREDAPKEVRKEYQRFLKAQEDAKKRGTKLFASK